MAEADARTDGELELARRRMRVATPEGLAVYKLIAFRPRDIDDILAVARTQARVGSAGRRVCRERRGRLSWAVEDRLAGSAPSSSRSRHPESEA